MPIRIVQSKQNSRLKDLRRALAHPGRDASSLKGRESCSLAGIEGPKLLEEALRAGLRVPTVFVAQGAEHLLEGLALPGETEVLLVPKELLESALATETPQPVAALVEPPAWNWADVLGGSEKTAPLMANAKSLIVVLAGLQDPGNLGTILRSAEAFGASGVLSLPGTVSEWNPKAVRASAGSVFRLPLLAVSEKDCFARLRRAGVKIWTTAAHGAEAADRIDLAGPVALLIGNEGNGVPVELAAQADGAVTILCPGPVESLNAAVAASVLLYEASWQRTGSKLKQFYR
ncbi:MAG: RNA methyltransferase [Terracidiphilus sp.]|jgi:TrmH family RNA methyltransferase